jgi:UDPglucose 6-dehydrogenase
MDVAVVGLGHLGLPLAAVFAAAGHRVFGADCDRGRVHRINQDDVAWYEPGLGALLRNTALSLQLTDDASAAVEVSDISVVVVPTPSAQDGSYDDRHVLEAVEAIGAALRRHDHRHTVVVVSTVMPGAVGGPIARRLQETAGRRLGQKLGLCYCPNFGALGNLLDAYRRPNFVLIGESDSDAGDAAAALYGSIVEGNVPVIRTSLVDAELAKIALNNFIITKISFANMLAGLCACTPGPDVNRVTSVLERDKRIGHGCLRAAMPFGGPCFGRDIEALVALGQRQGAVAPLAGAALEINTRHNAALINMLELAAPCGATVAILGLAFRQDTDVVVASPSIAIANALQASGRNVQAWDPLANEAARPFLHPSVRVAANAAGCLANASVVLVANADPAFAELDPALWGVAGKRPIVFDWWRILPVDRLSAIAEIRYLGIGPLSEVA